MREMNYNPGMRIVVDGKSVDASRPQNYLEVRDDGEKLHAIKWHVSAPRVLKKNHCLIRFK